MDADRNSRTTAIGLARYAKEYIEAPKVGYATFTKTYPAVAPALDAAQATRALVAALRG